MLALQTRIISPPLLLIFYHDLYLQLKGRSRSRATKSILKKPETTEQGHVAERNISLPYAEKEFKAGVNKANDNINNKDKSPLFKHIDIQQPSTNKENTNYEKHANFCSFHQNTEMLRHSCNDFQFP